MKYRKNTEGKNPKVARIKNRRIMLLSKFAVCDSKKIKIKQVSTRYIKQVSTRYKMSEIVNKSLLAGDKIMAEMHLRQPGFTYSACGSFT